MDIYFEVKGKEHTANIGFHIQPVEKSVGIFDPYVDEFYIIDIDGIKADSGDEFNALEKLFNQAYPDDESIHELIMDHWTESQAPDSPY